MQDELGTIERASESALETLVDDRVSCDAVNTRRSPSGLRRVKIHFEGELPNLQ